MVQIGARFQGVPSHDLCHAARHILRLVDVQPARELQVRRRRPDQTAPTEQRGQLQGLAVPRYRLFRLQHFVIVITGIHHACVRIQDRESSQSIQPVRRFARIDTAVVAARQLVLNASVGDFEERRGRDCPVEREPVIVDHGIRNVSVVETGDRPDLHHRPLNLAGVLTGDAQIRRELIVEANRRLLCQLVITGRVQLVVIVVSRHLRDIRQRVLIENGNSRSIQTALRDHLPGERLSRRAVHNRGNRVSVLVGALREIALPFRRGWQAQAHHVTAVGQNRLGPELMRVEEEELITPVIQFGNDHRAADRVAVSLQTGEHRCVAVLLRNP